jgi:hypothetical protein
MKLFEGFDPSSQVWIFTAIRPLSLIEQGTIAKKMQIFLEGWSSHGQALKTSYVMLQNQILLVAADQSQGQASGCAIDKLIAVIHDLENELPLNWTDRSKIVLQVEGVVTLTNSSDLKSGQFNMIPEATLVYNTAAYTVNQVQNDFLVPALGSWLRRFMVSNTAT